jgi:transcriptional regulator with XRE-family HTH domain
MDISKALRAEIERRGLTATNVAEGTGLPYSTVNEFMRGVREIGADKASKIADLLGFNLVISKLRSKAMSEYLELVKSIEDRGVSVDDDTMDAVKEFAENLAYIEEKFPDWDFDDAENAATFRHDIQWLEVNGWVSWSEDDADAAAVFRNNVAWLKENDWDVWSEDDATSIDEFVQNLKYLKKIGENPTQERIDEVAELVKNLKRLRDNE